MNTENSQTEKHPPAIELDADKSPRPYRQARTKVACYDHCENDDCENIEPLHTKYETWICTNCGHLNKNINPVVGA
jgi:rubrerythrin